MTLYIPLTILIVVEPDNFQFHIGPVLFAIFLVSMFLYF